MDNKLILFSTSACENCNIIKRIFREYEVPFIEKNIEGSEENQKELMNITEGKKIVPTIKFNNQVYLNIKPHEVLVRISYIKEKL